MHQPEAPPPARPAAALARLFACVSLGATGFLASMTVAALIAEDLLGSADWSGIPGALAILGIGVGAPVLSSLMARHGRSAGLMAGYVVAALASVLAAAATAAGSFPGFALAMFLCGAGYAANHLARYAAADLRPARPAAAIGWIVWAGTAGAVAGPSLLVPGRIVAERAGVNPLAGAPLLGGLALLGALSLAAGLRRRLPSAEAPVAAGPSLPTAPAPEPLSPRARFALLALVLNQLVMALVMAMTPIHIHRSDQPLASVSFVLSAHMVGMFALAPVVGALAERLGRLRVLLIGHALAGGSAALASRTAGGDVAALGVALFGLGLGWSFAFVSGSALLSESTRPARRMRVQGRGDAMVAAAAATANLLSGALLASGGYALLSLIAAALASIPPALALWRRRALALALATE